jgi:hypothetical protein
MDHPEKLLGVLKRQKLLSGTNLQRLVDAVCTGQVTDTSSLREYVKSELDISPKTAWVQNTWRNIQSAKTCTDIVVVEPQDVVPPPPSMVQLVCAMRGLMYDSKPVPIVSPPKGVGVTTNSDFDRNDWYLTNSSTMDALTQERRGVFENRLCLVCLVMGSRKYITWCKRRDIRTIVSDVNSEKVVLNKHATVAIKRGDLFTSVDVLDDDLGQLLMRDVDDVLYMIERTAGNYNTRYPQGFNIPPPHLVHRSLRELGGDWETLRIHGEWVEAEAALKTQITRVRNTAKMYQKFRDVVAATDPESDVLDAMKAKCDAKFCDTEREVETVRRTHDNVRILRTRMKDAVVNSIAECLLNKREVPGRLHKLKDHLIEVLNLPSEIDKVIAYASKKLGTVSDVSDAMILLGLWDGISPKPTLTRESVKNAFRVTHRTHHPDKTKENPSPKYSPEKLDRARTLLYKYC